MTLQITPQMNVEQIESPAAVDDVVLRKASQDQCGCDAFRSKTAMSRRTVLGGMVAAGGLLAAGNVLGPLTTRVAYAASPGYVGDTLVVLSLRGGFDGLSAVVPAGDADYYRLRPGIAIPAAQTLQLDSRFGLHPALAPLMPLVNAGQMGFVQAVGLPAPNRSHFSAMDEIEQAAPGSSLRTGWLDRTLALNDASGPFGAVQIGSTDIPYSLIGGFPALAMDSLSGFKLNSTYDAASRTKWGTALRSLHSHAGTELSSAVGQTLSAFDDAATLAGSTYDAANGAVYPDSDLGRALSDVARLIKGNVGARVVTIDEGNWDMHSGMGTVDQGWMHDHLTDLGLALAAFATDLGSKLADVTLLTMTEFGRRAQENESMGVDHGWGTAMMMLGGGVIAGVHGTWPGLTDAALNDGDLAVTTDYRAVLAEVLADRCGASVAQAATVFPAFQGSAIGVTRARS